MVIAGNHLKMQRFNLKDLSLQKMEDLVSSLGEKPYRVHQIYEWVFQKDVSSIGEMTNLSKNLRNQLSELSYISAYPLPIKEFQKTAQKNIFLCWRMGIV